MKRNIHLVIALASVAVFGLSLCLGREIDAQLPISSEHGSPMMRTNIAIMNSDTSPSVAQYDNGAYIDSKSLIDRASDIQNLNKVDDIEEDDDDRFITSRSGKLRPNYQYGQEDAENWADEAPVGTMSRRVRRSPGVDEFEEDINAERIRHNKRTKRRKVEGQQDAGSAAPSISGQHVPATAGELPQAPIGSVGRILSRVRRCGGGGDDDDDDDDASRARRRARRTRRTKKVKKVKKNKKKSKKTKKTVVTKKVIQNGQVVSETTETVESGKAVKATTDPQQVATVVTQGTAPVVQHTISTQHTVQVHAAPAVAQVKQPVQTVVQPADAVVQAPAATVVEATSAK